MRARANLREKELDKQAGNGYTINCDFVDGGAKGGRGMDIDMDIKELEAFVYVVENCSFSLSLIHI